MCFAGGVVDLVFGDMNDDDVVNAMAYAKHCNVRIHVRGTDERPVVEPIDKTTRRVVGGTELKRRMATWNTDKSQGS